MYIYIHIDEYEKLFLFQLDIREKKFLVDKMNDNKREKFNRWKKCCRNASKKLIESDKVIE